MTYQDGQIHYDIFNFCGQSTIDTWVIRDVINEIGWVKYDKFRVEEIALSLQRIRELADAFPFWQHRKRTGRPPIPERDIMIGLLLQTFLNLKFRMTQCFLKIFQEYFNIERVPHHTVLSKKNRSKRWKSVIRRFNYFILDMLPDRKGVLATDATGYSGRKVAWKDVDYGLRATQDWEKLHACIETDTFLILSYTLTKSNVHDSQEFESIWNNLPDNVDPKRSLADSAYGGDDCLSVAREKGAIPIHDVKSNAVHVSEPETAYGKLVNFAIHWPNRFQELYKDRQLVETVFSMIEAHFGYRLKCRTKIGRQNEVQSKICAHNIRLLNAMEFYANS